METTRVTSHTAAPLTAATPRKHTAKAPAADPAPATAAADPGDSVNITSTAKKSSKSTAATATATASTRPPKPNPNDPQVTDNKPIVGDVAAAPTYTAGALKSPVFKGTEAQYFKEALSIIQNAKPGDIVGAQMYEFQNAQTNPDSKGATNAPGYADQQALLPALAAAAARGVNVQVILDASKNEKTKELNNQPIIDYLKAAGAKTGNITLDLYPPNTVNIDHAKEIFHLAKGAGGSYTMDEALGGGSNWGNHTPANDDGGGAFYGRDAMGAARIFFRDQAFCRGDTTSAPDAPDDPNAAVQWHTTSPTAEGGGSTVIKQEKLDNIKQYPTLYSEQFCDNNPDLLKAEEGLGKGMHLRADPHEGPVNRPGITGIRASGGQAGWANTTLDPADGPGDPSKSSGDYPGSIQHAKLDINVDANGVPQVLTIGSANDTGNGLETTHKSDAEAASEAAQTWSTEEKSTTKKTNHEIDVQVRRETQGNYTTATFLDDAYAKVKNDFTGNRILDSPPAGLNGDGGGGPTF
jgi:hypothetical protein